MRRMGRQRRRTLLCRRE